jgi:phosphate starvation-inducible PhoH-like protein
MAKKTKRSRDYNEEAEQIEQWTQERATKKKEEINMNYSINIKCKSKTQKDVIQSIDDKDISIITGPPGSGKTYLACAKALKFIKDEPEKYKEIVLIKSVNGPKDENLGFMKGTMEEKMEMHVYPFMSNFNKVAGDAIVKQYVEDGTIYVLPIMFALGVSLDNSNYR